MGVSFLIITVVVASAVEMVEAMTIVLASGLTRGWRSTLEGAGLALFALAAIVALLGTTLTHWVPLSALRLLVGTLLLIFGLQWLRKAILRASGYKALHDELGIFQATTAALTKSGKPAAKRNALAFTVSFKGVFLEGLEVIVIVISFGLPGGHLGVASLAAGVTALAVGTVGFALAKPLAGVPENAMKTVVGVLLVSFGIFWAGEGAGVEWWAGDWFLVMLVAATAGVTAILNAALNVRRHAATVAVRQ
jgi:uncharacterized membrane protein